MKYLSQFLIILGFTFAGEALQRTLPLPIPASVYGLLLLFGSLCLGLVKLEQVKETGHFLVQIMPMLFIPATVGLLESWDVMQSFLTAIIVISLVSTVLVTLASGHATQFIINLKKKDKKQ